jgi:hypothetical protein
MAGKIRQMIDFIIDHSAKDNPMMERVIKTKMILKGINPAKYTAQSEDEPSIISKLENMMQTFCVATSGTHSDTPKKPSAGTIKTAFSKLATPEACVNEIQQQFAGMEPAMIIFFSSIHHAPQDISRHMHGGFPNAQVFGCTTAGEITSGHMLSGSVVAMAFSAEAAQDMKIEVIQNLKQRSAIEQALHHCSIHFGQPVASMDPSRYVGILLIDGLAGIEEKVIETLGDLTNVPFIGGSAGDDLQFSATHVYANGSCYTNAAILALLKPGIGFSFIKTQSFRFLGKTLRVTKADEANREVLQFNDKPAAAAYAEALGVPVSEVSKHFMRNPIGLVVDGEPYVRSPQRIKGDTMFFYCGVKEGMKLSLLESTDMIGDTRQAIAQAQKKHGSISGIINFDCILRTLDLRQQNLCGEYGNLFADIPTVGFSTYGEQYIGHINQTSTMLVFG